MKTTHWYIFHEGRILLKKRFKLYQIPIGEEPPVVNICHTHMFRESDDTQYITAQATSDIPLEGYEWTELRKSYSLVTHSAYQEAGKAAEILYFDLHHQYCGICGGAMSWHSPISKHCTNCGEELWPQLNTAIIVLIHKGKEALLVKSRNFKRDFYGLVAGFVETGESLEECVRREVREETGLEISHIRYYGSQPWPYPIGLMIGFHADYAGGNICLADNELCDAKFFTPDNLPNIPEKLSMARMLIDDWVANP